MGLVLVYLRRDLDVISTSFWVESSVGCIHQLQLSVSKDDGCDQKT